MTPTHTLLRFTDAAEAERVYRHLRFHPELVTVQYNWAVQPRRAPNDPDYDRQDNLQRLGFPELWDQTTGGSLPNGVPIVTAVLDAGFDAEHEDLRDNLWVNAGEVPGDGVDNDGNGYVDDVHGFNFIDSLGGEYNINAHGTQVTGIVGAVGDNGIGVAGTHWEAHLMLFSIRTVADIVQAYTYVVDQRRAFNESRGARGAFVAATNASFGVEGATCADFPVWGAMYDRLGEVGVLTAASVANAPIDVDLTEDMPTDCPSEFLLTVTNVGLHNELQPTAAYGLSQVDLAATGEGSYTTRPGDRYGPFGSTSAAAPYVTGAISLLYATACPQLVATLFERPAVAARLVRDAILEGTVANASLSGKTVTGGVLEVAAAHELLAASCPAPDPQDLVVTSISPNPTTGPVVLLINQLVLPEGLSVRMLNAVGQYVTDVVYEPVFASTAGLRLDLGGLPAGYYLISLGGKTLHAHAAVVVH
ncbi:S8 family serine peptidase [Neolewinella sp.]|uniref:S8 family serine peptidase n=1 Tax=Neolewinella sp. TaxID=2993543 RepID=UPI003B51DCB9